MPAHSILGWLHRRRSLALAARRIAEPFRTPQTGWFAGRAATRAESSRRLLHAPTDWRERMMASLHPTSRSHVATGVEPLPSTPAYDERYALGDVGAQRRDVEDRGVPNVQAERSEALAQIRERGGENPAAAAFATLRSEAPVRTAPAARAPITGAPDAGALDARALDTAGLRRPPETTLPPVGAPRDVDVRERAARDIGPDIQPRIDRSMEIVPRMASAQPPHAVPEAGGFEATTGLDPARASLPPQVRTSDAPQAQQPTPASAREAGTGEPVLPADEPLRAGRAAAGDLSRQGSAPASEASPIPTEPRVRRADDSTIVPASADSATREMLAALDRIERPEHTPARTPLLVPTDDVDREAAPPATRATAAHEQTTRGGATRDETTREALAHEAARRTAASRDAGAPDAATHPKPHADDLASHATASVDRTAELTEANDASGRPMRLSGEMPKKSLAEALTKAIATPAAAGIVHQPTHGDATELVRRPAAPSERPPIAAAEDATDHAAAAATAPPQRLSPEAPTVADTERASNAPDEPELDATSAAALAADAPSAGPSATPAAAPGVSRESTQRKGIHPIEERRARRPAGRPNAPPAPKSSEPAARAPTPPLADDASDATPTVERSMSEWRRLLFEATSPPAPSTPPAPTAEQPPTPERAPEPSYARLADSTNAPPANAPPDTTPLLETTRRFLHPRVGIDPATVPIVRGPRAERVVAETGADAAAVGEVIALPSIHDERDPRTLGLIAHELTHVAQRRQPRFVPPIVRAPLAADGSAEREQPRSWPASPASEETLARRVEHAVWSDVEDRPSRGDERAFVNDDARAIESTSSDFERPARGDTHEWGNLPAPWEPMPSDLRARSDVGASPATVSPERDAPPIHYAEHGRAPEGNASPAAAQGAAPAAAPAPDLDALARRVYDVLKRRLAAERRREG